MAREYNAWDKTFYHRAIQTKIGQGLREQYDQDLARPLPHNLFTLVMQLGEQQERGRMARVEKARSLNEFQVISSDHKDQFSLIV